MDQKICKLEQEKYELDRKLSQATAYMDITDSAREQLEQERVIHKREIEHLRTVYNDERDKTNEYETKMYKMDEQLERSEQKCLLLEQRLEKLEADHHRVQLENARLETELKQKTEMLQRVLAGSQKHEHKKKLHGRQHSASKKAIRTPKQQKTRYDVKAQESKLTPCDLVDLWKVKLKIDDRWKDDPFIIVSQLSSESPGNDAKKDSSTTRKSRLVRENKAKYVTPQRRHGVDIDDGKHELRRSERIRRQPTKPLYTTLWNA